MSQGIPIEIHLDLLERNEMETGMFVYLLAAQGNILCVGLLFRNWLKNYNNVYWRLFVFIAINES